ncbi:MAG: trypsin-like peptidase domain-containing protein [bacterium]|nr:trypsin-like peptidase domain-containing protein [bacterium]
MRSRRSLLLVAAGLALAVPLATLVPTGMIVSKEQPILTLVQVQEETARGVVHITGYVKNPAGIKVRRSMGSGFVVLEDGKLMIVSNNHVVAGMEELWASTAEKTIPPFELGVIGYSPFLDLALLEIKNPPTGPDGTVGAGGLVPVRLGNSDALKADDPVIAIGSPLGIRFLAFQGVVTKPDEMPSNTTHPSLIISDVKLNLGNSGGPLFTPRGEVVGVNTLIAGPNPISFSIPINNLKAVLPRLKLGGEIKHAMAGMGIGNSWEMNPLDYKNAKIEPPKRLGVLVVQVVPASPAAKAGIAPGDLVLDATLKDVNVSVTDAKAFMKLMMLQALPDDELTLLVLRGENQYHTMRLRLTLRPAPSPGEDESDD